MLEAIGKTSSGQKTRINPSTVMLFGPAMTGGGAEGRFGRISTKVFDGDCLVAVLSCPKKNAKSQHASNFRNLGWKGRLSYPIIIWRLARLFESQEVAVVFSFGLFPNLLAIVARNFSRQKPKIIIHEITRPLESLKKMKRLRSFFYYRLQKHIYPFADTVTANSTDGLNEIKTFCPNSNSNFSILGNSFDFEEINSMSLDCDSVSGFDFRYIVCVGRLVELKRFDTVIRALPLLSISPPVKLLIVGEGPCKVDLEALVDKLRLNKQVTFCGHRSNPLPLIRRAHAFVSASEYEGSSNSVIEAMALGVPVVSSFCSTDVRNMHESGAILAFNTGDSAELASKIEVIFSDDKRREELANLGRKYCIPQRYETSIPQYENVIVSTIS